MTLEDMLCRYLEESEERVLSPLSVPGKNITGNVPAIIISSLVPILHNGKMKYFGVFGVLFAVCQILRTNLLLCSLYCVATCSVNRIACINIH